MKTVVILRPVDECAEISDEIKIRGFDPFAEPIITIEYIDADYPDFDENTPLIFTSANGVRAFAQKYVDRTQQIYTVGRNTADEARLCGFTKVESANGNAADMVNLFTKPLKISGKCPLYVRGEAVSSDLKSIFAKKYLNISEIIVYRSNLADNLSINLLKSLDSEKITAIMFFSVRGSRNFVQLIEQYGRVRTLKTIKALCISDAVVNCLSALPFQEVVVADQPDRYGMIKLLDRLS